MRQRNNAFKEIRYKVAQEALAGIKVGVLARKYDVSPKLGEGVPGHVWRRCSAYN
jgi:hypothetical protein